MTEVIKVENLFKEYRLGVIGHGTLYRDLQSSWARFRGRDDPNSIIGGGTAPARRENILSLSGVNLSVREGEILGIIGKNGAGKSTLLKILSRVTAPTKGLIKVRGRVASLLEVGTGFHGELTGRENIYLNGAINGMRRAEVSRKLDEIVDFAGIEKFLDTPAKRYSSGMTVRLGFSVAAHLDPEILVVDEVLSVGDAAFQTRCLTKLGSIATSGRTVLFVSHQMPLITNLCTRAVLLEDGQVREDGPPDSVVKKYLEAQVSRSKWSLRDRTDRKGNGRVRCVDVWIEDQDKKHVNAGKSGEEVRICANYEIVGSEDPSGLRAAFSVSNMAGVEIVNFFNRVTGQEFVGDIPRSGIITCVVGKLPLTKGRYSMDIHLSGLDKTLLDHVAHAFTFDVVDGDFFGTGRLDESRLILVDHHWVIEGTNNYEE